MPHLPTECKTPSSSVCTLAGSPWEIKSTYANEESEKAMPSMFPNSLKSARLSS